MIDSFAKFTRLRQGSTLLPKNLLCAEALVLTAIHDRNFWKGGWEIVLGDLSALFRIAPTAKTEAILATAEELFTQSSSLDRESILDFAHAMCRISYQELRVANPQPYLLLKFDVVAFWNMDRPMFLWTEIWTIIGNYLSQEGYSISESYGVTIVDVIRQLSRKFLAKQESTQFHFQRHFLQPFLDIYEQSPVDSTRELVLDCVLSLAVEFANTVHSGWDVFFRILSTAAVREAVSLKVKAFSILERLLEQVLPFLRPHLVHLMGVIRDFVRYDNDEVLALQGVAKFLLLGGAIDADEEDKWLCLIQNVGTCLQHSRVDVRHCAEETLLSLATAHGCIANSFAPPVWSHYLDTILIDLFPVVPNDAGHTLVLLTSVCTHLIAEYDERLSAYRPDVLRFLFHCCAIRDSAVQECALDAIAEYVEAHTAAVEGELMELLVQLLRALIPAMVTSVKFVETLVRLTRALADDERLAAVMPLLEELSDACRKAGGAVHACWTAARSAYFRILIRQGKSEETARHLAGTLTYFQGKRSIQQWNDLVVVCLTQVRVLPPDAFECCCQTSILHLCNLIETESKVVRVQLIDVLRRRLEPVA
jgi:hypothetical protein